MPERDPPMPSVPESRAVPKKQTRLSLVWFIPIVAALVGVWVAVARIRSEGPKITIVFQSAEGLEAGKTKINYRGVDIGTKRLIYGLIAEIARKGVAVVWYSTDARELVGAEERARRATAVDLHDGIGQQLVGLAMTLDAVAARSPPEVRLLLGEATHTVREVQSIAQRVIADLSPPGLYELGLGPALKWLIIYMRSKDNFRVDLHAPADDAAIDLDLRVLVFKVIRELLRNAVKHSGAQSAMVTVTQTPRELRVVVEDYGVGFEWQLSLFEPRAHGFGLWSVADRVREAAGEMTVDTGPGRGCRVTVVFPLVGAENAMQQPDSRRASSGA